MKSIELKFLNESGSNKVHYLPYGVTSLEMTIVGDQDEVEGFVYPLKRTLGTNNYHIGYADNSKDFLVLWGAGRREGLKIDENNINRRLFLQVLHKDKKTSSQTLSLLHSNCLTPVAKVELNPALDDEDTIRMKMIQEEQICTISFTGSKMPLYYPRWFPPRPLEGKSIQYSNVIAPPIFIKFKVKEDEFSSNIYSDLDVFYNKEKIAEISGDWYYSWPHAEIFTVFGDSDFIVLRLWLYWAHENFSEKLLLGGDVLFSEIDIADDEETKRGFWERFDIESPDIERFDFLIDLKKRAVVYVGTDFHYQEYWYEVDEGKIAKAAIANDIETIFQVLKNLKNRFDPPENYNPWKTLQKTLEVQNTHAFESELVPEIKKYTVSNFDDNGNVTYRAAGFTRKHVPYVKNGRAVENLVSSVVTG